MYLLLPLLTFSGILIPFGPSTVHGYVLQGNQDANDIVSITLPPSSGVCGTLTVHRAQLAKYSKDELGIDPDKLRNHHYREQQQLVDSGNSYTLPEGSGVEGVISWNLTDRNTLSTSSTVVPYYQRLTCNDCWYLCAIPFLGPAICMAICIGQMHCWD